MVLEETRPGLGAAALDLIGQGRLSARTMRGVAPGSTFVVRFPFPNPLP